MNCVGELFTRSWQQSNGDQSRGAGFSQGFSSLHPSPVNVHCHSAHRRSNFSLLMDGDAPTLQEITQLTRQELTTKRDDDAIHECGRAALALLSTDPELATRLAYQKLHDVPYKDVRTCWRRMYTDANLWTVLRLVEGRNEEAAQEAQQEMERSEGSGEDWIDETIKALDMALILTGAPAREDLVELWFSALQCQLYPPGQSHSPSETAPSRPCKRRKLWLPSPPTMPSTFVATLPNPAPTIEYPIPRALAPSFEAFQRKLDDPNSHTPLIIEGAMQHWPALDERPWNNPSYLMRQTLGGRRLVPVEIGRSYTDEAWGQRVQTFREFMETYMLNGLHVHDAPGKEHATTFTKSNQTQPQTQPPKEQPQTGYLAQHDLFTQIPSLRADICIPEYCYCTPSPTHKPPTSPSPSSPSPSSPSPTPTQPLLNAWFGPAHTISPLHTDPHHNILAQVVGYKYVRLYAPCETSRLYPRGREAGGVDMGNTSAVDLEEAGVVVLGGQGGEGGQEAEERKRAFEERFPRFREARYVEGVLGPGECLYLPVGWWHYVRSLTPSFSVSFWF